MSSASSPTPPTPPVSERGVEDASRRTRLANERTYLAWWRTSLTAVAVAVGIGRIAPDVGNKTRWPYEILGVGYGLFAAVFVIFAYRRARVVEDALDEGRFAPLSDQSLFVLSACGVVLALATIVVLIAD